MHSKRKPDYLFQTNRLAVRRWRPEDAPDILNLYSDREVVRWVDDGEPLSPQEARAWMGVTAANYISRGYGMFAIEDRNTGATIGFGGIVHPGGQEEPEVKYAFARPSWGQGLASEFLQALLSYAWADLKLMHITATVHPANKASARVLQKCSFRRVHSRSGADGEPVDTYSLDPPGQQPKTSGPFRGG